MWRPSSGARLRASLPRRIKAAFTERLPVKATALFLAFVLWMVVEGEEPARDVVDVRLALALDSGLVLVSERPQIKAQVVGPAREVLQLAALPPEVFLPYDGSVGDSVTVELHTDDVRLPQEIDRTRVEAVEPRMFILRFDSLLHRRLPVRSMLTVTNTAGTPIAVEPTFEPESVMVSGQRRTVQQLESIATVRRRVEVRDTTVIEVQLDTLQLGVRVTPLRVRARIAPPSGAGRPPDGGLP
jgi:hypothetical protein